MCDWQFRCCTLPEVDAIGGSSYVTPADCRPATVLGLETLLGEARAAATVGNVTLDPARATACLHTFDGASCSSPAFPQDPWMRFAGCPDPFVGQVAAGAPCRLRDECAPGARCVPSGQPYDTIFERTPEGLTALPTIQYAMDVFGSCIPYVVEGDQCRTTNDCAPGLYCRPDSFVCARPAAVGEVCLSASPLGVPAITRPCDDARGSVICDGGVCGRLPRAGEPCNGDGLRPACDPDSSLALACVGSAFNGTGICEPLGQTGAICGGDGLAACGPALACVGADGSTQFGACGRPPALGEPCAFPAFCGPGTVCDADTATCTRTKAQRDGTSCSTGADCASLTCVERAPGVGMCGTPVIDHIACTGVAPAMAVVAAAQ
jgi:hypothetical protein